MLIKFDDETPEWVELDYNNNQVLDKEDKYFYKNKNGDFEIDIKLFANRITSNSGPYDYIWTLSTAKTKFAKPKFNFLSTLIPSVKDLLTAASIH